MASETADRDIVDLHGWKGVFADMAEGALKAVRRFPIVALLLVVLAFEVNADIGGWAFFDWWDDEETFALAAAVAAALAAALTFEARLPNLPQIALSALAAVLAWLVVDFREALRLYDPAFGAALFGLILVGPFLGRGTSQGFWLFVVRCFFAGLLASMALLLFAGGFSAILASLTYLFGIEVPEELYGHVWATAGLFAAPLFGLGQLPDDFTAEETGEQPTYVRHGMRVLGDYVAAPLLLVYAVLLHIYAVMILTTGDWPAGQVGWLVLTFGICLFAALMVIHPFFTIARPPTRLLLKVWPFLLPVPILILFLAAYERISVYGVTPQRYLLVAFGVAAALIVAAQLIPRLRGDIRVMAVLPVVALLLASLGPLGAEAVSIRSQAERFRQLVAEPPFSAEQNVEAMQALDYLTYADALEEVAPADLPRTGRGLARRIAISYGLNPDLRQTGPEAQLHKSFQLPAAVDLAGYDLALTGFALTHEARPRQWQLPGGGSVFVMLRDDAIMIRRGSERVVFPVPQDVRDRLLEATESFFGPIELSAGGKTLRLFPDAASFQSAGTANGLVAISGLLLLQSDSWAPAD